MKWKTVLPHITMIIWGSLIFPLGAFGADFPGCPTGTFQTEMTSPIDAHKKILCSKKAPDGYLKHGPEWTYDSQGKLLQKSSYKDGELVSQDQDLDNKTQNNDADTEESNTLKKDYSFIKTIMHEILHIWHPLKRPSRARIALGGFETRSCGVNNYTLKRFYQNQTKSFDLSLKFSKKCSLQGHAQLVWERPQKIKLKLRDMRDFNEIEMQLTLFKTTKKSGEDTLYRVQTQITQGILRTETGGLLFEMDYILSLDPNKRKALKGHDGELRILEYNAVKIDESYPLNLKALELD